MENFENTFLYASLLDTMEKYDEYDPKLIEELKEDWNRIMDKMMEDKQNENSGESRRISKDGKEEME